MSIVLSDRAKCLKMRGHTLRVSILTHGCNRRCRLRDNENSIRLEGGQITFLLPELPQGPFFS
jgi:pyruvate-formate lyase-activating enzyme